MEKRIIKFRCWDIHKKQFIPADTYGIITTDFKAFGVMLKDWEDYREGEYMYDNAQILSQFTGLLDKSGKEIYEGDVLCYCGTNMSSMLVKFQDGCFVGEGPFNTHPLITYMEADDFQFIEIEGNVYEHPYLLTP